MLYIGCLSHCDFVRLTKYTYIFVVSSLQYIVCVFAVFGRVEQKKKHHTPYVCMQWQTYKNWISRLNACTIENSIEDRITQSNYFHYYYDINISQTLLFQINSNEIVHVHTQSLISITIRKSENEPNHFQ